MIKECIILAGGLGTRLRSAVTDLPKCMAPVAEKPFLHWIIKNLQLQNVSSFIFSLGYMHEKIEAYIKEEYPTLNAKFSIEDEPLGTGGAIKLALSQCREEQVLVLNGDTLFEVDNTAIYKKHVAVNAACTLSLKPMINFDRYGCVTVNEEMQVIAFEEKKYMNEGLINGGVYLLNQQVFSSLAFPEKFSFEKEFLETYVKEFQFMAVVNDGYFIDIGIPEDFKKANEEIKLKYDSLS